MGFKCGIVGLPNVGKSTLFNALTQAGIEAANYPFCTIEPHVGIVILPDERLDKLAAIIDPEKKRPPKIVPTTTEFVDIAGLVKGASKGEGLGNKFLANIRETDAIAHVVRCFGEESDITHVCGKVSPLDDIDTVNTELALADLETVEKALLKSLKAGKTGNKEALSEIQALERIKAHLDKGCSIRTLSLSEEERVIIARYSFLTAKPVFYIANIDDNGYENNPLLTLVQNRAQEEKTHVVALSAATEAALMELNASDRKEFMADLGLTEPGLNRVIRAGYDILGLHTYFTAGVKEVRAWTIIKGATAPQAAGVIHTDFEKGFIRAEVIPYEAFIQYKGEAGAKDAGKLRVEGKDYIVKDGDVIHFRFNV